MELFAGAYVAGRYLAEEKVGEGSFGAVWSAKHLGLGTKVALKTLLPAAAADDETVARFRREARLLARIQSDYVVRVLDFVHDDAYGLVLVLDFLEGQLLFDALRDKPASVEEAIRVGVDLLHGLVDLHAAHVIHRDLKPGNVLLRRTPGGGRRAVIFDFSLSREDATRRDESSLTDLTKSNVVMGTLPYMAPEQALNAREVTERSDVYAVGAILYRMVTGKQLFADAGTEMLRTKLTTEAPTVETGRSDATARRFEAIVARAVQRRPSRRYPSAREMLNDLAALRRTLPAESGDEDVATTLPDGVRAATADVVVTTEPTEDQLTLRISSPGPAPSIAPARVRPWRTALAVVAGGALFAGGIAVGSVWAERRAAELAEKPVDAGSFAATEPVAPTADAGDASSGELAAEDAGPDEGAVDLDADLGYDAASARVIVLATRHAAPGTAHTATPEVAATDLPHAAPPASDAATSRAVFAAPRASASSRPSSVPWPVELPREAGAASGDGTGSTPSPSVPP